MGSVLGFPGADPADVARPTMLSFDRPDALRALNELQAAELGHPETATRIAGFR